MADKLKWVCSHVVRANLTEKPKECLDRTMNKGDT